MTVGHLLDTNSLLWSGNNALMKPAAYTALLPASENGTLFTSAISSWELTFASRKRHLPSRPDLRGKTPRDWFNDAIRRLNVAVLPIDSSLAAEAAEAAVAYGSGDPGDCLMVATAHLHNLTLITRDARILKFAFKNPAYLSVIQC